MERTKYIPSRIHNEDEVGKTEGPSLILTSDWHLREDTPTCWTGDFDEEQWNSVLFVKRLQTQYDCPVVHAGDLFHHWKPSPYLLTRTIKYLPDQFYTVYGQHDLPQHNLDLSIKSGVNTLMEAGVLKVLDECHFGQEPSPPLRSILTRENGEKHEITEPFPNPNILVWHHMTYINPPFPGAKEGQAESVLKKYPQFDLIVTGDNHQSFWTKVKGRLLVNPGNLTRQTADQMNYKPRVYLWYAETNTVEPVFVPIQKDAITREHIEKKEQRDERISAFISKLDEEWGLSWSYPETLEQFFAKNKTKDSIKNIIYKAME
jgi:DNA repair exonuclease SbcCD nuclease subunit